MRWLAILVGLSVLLPGCTSRRGGVPSQTFPTAARPPAAPSAEQTRPVTPLPQPEATSTATVTQQQVKPVPPPPAPRPAPIPAPAPANAGSSVPAPAPVVTSGNPLIGRISSVNSTARFVVLTYSIGHLPAVDRRLNVYRQGLKVAELKVTGPSQDINTVADILAGECQVGDEVREN